jgi:ATP-dependent DNA helicase RecG
VIKFPQVIKLGGHVDQAELQVVVALLRTHTTDLSDIEAKAGAGGLPKSVRETISSFSNGTGGTIILGLDERSGFAPAAPFDAARIRDDLASLCSTDMEPPVRADVDLVTLDQHPLVVAEIPELDPRFKPCYVKSRGEYNGSFIRSGDGDRRLSDFEIHLLHTNRGQPEDDRAPVTQASLDDLDSDAVAALLRRVRQRQRRVFAGLDDETALRRLNVVTRRDDELAIPTLAGLLALGIYPQQFVPQLNVTFVVYPGTSADAIPASGPRFLDNRTFDGPIPVIVEDALAAVVRNMSIRSFIEGAGRRDVYDYPVEALREAIVNALVHRDYSPYSRGTAVQIVMYADRLMIANPGGLYGTVTEDDLGGEGVSSTRNSVLMRLLQDVQLPDGDGTVCENRGSGIPTILRELRRAGSALPEFHNRINRFKVIFPKHALLDDATLEWIRGLAVELSPTQHMALAMLRHGKTVTNQTLRNLGLDGRRATTELSALVNLGLAVRIGERRHARYVLAAVGPTSGAEPSHETTGADRTAMLLSVLPAGAELSRQQLHELTGIPQASILRLLNNLVTQGVVEATAPPRSPNRRYRRPLRQR